MVIPSITLTSSLAPRISSHSRSSSSVLTSMQTCTASLASPEKEEPLPPAFPAPRYRAIESPTPNTHITHCASPHVPHDLAQNTCQSVPRLSAIAIIYRIIGQHYSANQPSSSYANIAHQTRTNGSQSAKTQSKSPAPSPPSSQSPRSANDPHRPARDHRPIGDLRRARKRHRAAVNIFGYLWEMAQHH